MDRVVWEYVQFQDFLRKSGASPRLSAMGYISEPDAKVVAAPSGQYFTTEPEHIKAILATQFDSYEKGKSFSVFWRPRPGLALMGSWLSDISFLSYLGPEFNLAMESILGVGVFNSDGMFLYQPKGI